MKDTQIRGKPFVLEEHSNNETGKRNGSFGVFFPSEGIPTYTGAARLSSFMSHRR